MPWEHIEGSQEGYGKSGIWEEQGWLRQREESNGERSAASAKARSLAWHTLNRMLTFSESFNLGVQEWGEPQCVTWPPCRGDAACGPGFWPLLLVQWSVCVWHTRYVLLWLCLWSESLSAGVTCETDGVQCFSHSWLLPTTLPFHLSICPFTGPSIHPVSIYWVSTLPGIGSSARTLKTQ